MHREITILIVDDDPDDLALIEKALRRICGSAMVQTLGDGEQAIGYMMGEGKFSDRRRFPYPTFIMTDLKMPGADGFAILEHLKANPAWAIIPTVVLSGSSDLDDIRTAYLLGASSYHVKPATMEGLRAQLKIVYDYWMTCQVPEIDISGKQLPTDHRGKIGERFPQPTSPKQTRAKH